MKRIIFTEKAPKPVGTYSQGVLIDNFLFTAGQIPIDPSTGEIVQEFDKACQRVLENIKAIVEAAGGDLRDVVKVTVYMKDVKKFSKFNEIYAKYFKEDPPARVVVEVSELPKGVELMVDAIAYLKR